MATKDTVQLTTRLNKTLLQKLDYIAKFDGRTRHEECELMIREWIRAFEDVCGEVDPKAPSDEGAVSRQAD